MKNFFDQYFNSLSRHIEAYDYDDLLSFSEAIENIKSKRGKLLLFGNGGSAAIASHAAVDFSKTLNVRAMTCSESSLVTCLSNDYGYEEWIEKAIDYYSDANDLIVIISSSGESENVIRGAVRAKELNLKLITFSGFSPDNRLRKLGDIAFWVDSSVYNFIENVHQSWLLSIVDFLSHKDTN